MKHNERCKECKENVYEMLKAIFDEVEENYDIGMPTELQEYNSYNKPSVYENLGSIYRALQGYRGHEKFVKTKKLASVDFFIPSQKLIIEFDETQHFTEAREIALSHYSSAQNFGFCTRRWQELSHELHKKDNDPPYRDEQRAWYDTLRDFAPILWGQGRTIRLYSNDLQWCSLKSHKETDIQKFKEFLK